MMVQATCLIIACVIGMTCAAANSYQFVRFLNNNNNNNNKQHPSPPRLLQHQKVPGTRPPRSYHFPLEYFDLPDIWPHELFLQPENNIFDFTVGHTDTHYTPDFSNGLAYPDPLLVTGNDARRAVNFLYGKGELFFHNIPHVRAVLKLQNDRKHNGLQPNRLGSLNHRSPFYRL